MIAAASSGSGKTMLTCGILNALKKRNLRIAAFKCGPDYIDPMFHRKILGVPSWNLDIFFTGYEGTRGLLVKHAEKMDAAVLEGVMGYYDGIGGVTTSAGSYDLANASGTPVVLIVNTKGMSLSAAALIKGFLEFRENSQIKGVILNRTSPSVYAGLKKVIEETLPVQVLGYVPEIPECSLESRHLGLFLPDEIEDLKGRIDRLSEVLEKCIDLDALLSIAGNAPELVSTESRLPLNSEMTPYPVRIAVSMDEAFCFTYEENLEFLKSAGACVVPFSPLHDAHLPEGTGGLILNGGYPENYADALSSNQPLREEIRARVAGGIPCIAECGGFLYLHDTLEDASGKIHEMCGVIPGRAFWSGRLKRFGYVDLVQNTGRDAPFGRKHRESIPAHEFHYYDSENPGDSFHAQKPVSKKSWDCIHTSKSLFAGFPHLYYPACPELILDFLREACRYREQDGKSGGGTV